MVTKMQDKFALWLYEKLYPWKELPNGGYIYRAKHQRLKRFIFYPFRRWLYRQLTDVSVRDN